MSRLASLLVLLALAGQAIAAEPKIKHLSFVDLAPAPDDPLASRVVLRGVVAAVPGLRAQDFSLRVGEDVVIGATKSVPFVASDDELALMILVQGTVRLMGNDAPGEDAIE